ncbi:hypothetical protein [Caulobacter phage KSC]|uniref:Uncharacterized protein n=1 Tax=Caulobacter phage KSC TaxID=3020398 RepID=A0AAF0B995_9CAUD|nr:hypothetical protein [Caulobacter phage KSC]
MDYTIRRVDGRGVYQGETSTVGAADGCPPGWVRAPIPENYVGHYAILTDGYWTYVTDLPPEPPSPVPERLSMLQATLALIHFGAYEAVDAAIKGSSDPVLKAYWEKSTEGFERYHPAILLVQAWMGWDDQTIDDMFRFGATCK